MKVFLFFLILFDCIILKISSSKDLKDARNMVEKKGLIACEQKYQLKKCILSIFFNKLPLEIKPKTDLVSQSISTLQIDSKVNFINRGSLMFLTSEKKGRLFTKYGSDLYSIWMIQKAEGSYRRIQNVATKLYLEANKNGNVFSNIFMNNSTGQEWSIIDGIVQNREYNTVLYGDLNGQLKSKPLKDSLLARWTIKSFDSNNSDKRIDSNPTIKEIQKSLKALTSTEIDKLVMIQRNDGHGKNLG